MSGNKDGGKRAAETNKRLYGKDFYANIGAKGGRAGSTGGFFGEPERASEAGKKGIKARKKKLGW